MESYPIDSGNTELRPANLLDNIPQKMSDEIFETLLESSTLRIERIVSSGQSSPNGFWYDQESSEWILVLKGRAVIQFQGDNDAVELCEGSYINIPAHVKHRVEWTADDTETIWLAIHY